MSATALGGSLAVADIDYSTGRGMGTLADHVRIENELAKAQSELESLGDRRLSARLRFKSAMGLALGSRPRMAQGKTLAHGYPARMSFGAAR